MVSDLSLQGSLAISRTVSFLQANSFHVSHVYIIPLDTKECTAEEVVLKKEKIWLEYPQQVQTEKCEGTGIYTVDGRLKGAETGCAPLRQGL